VNEKPHMARIFRIEYAVMPRRDERGRFKRSRVKTYTKVQYGAVFGLSEALSRALSTGQIAWFRVATAKKGEITPDIRSHLERWPTALEQTSEVTAVQWNQ
jgi:hypothetical protein